VDDRSFRGAINRVTWQMSFSRLGQLSAIAAGDALELRLPGRILSAGHPAVISECAARFTPRAADPGLRGHRRLLLS
jgi:hypothetical protein